MRQQFKNEDSAQTTNNHSPVVTEDKYSIAVEQVASVTQSRNSNKWHGWPFLAIGTFLIICAGYSFYLSLGSLNPSPDINIDVEEIFHINYIADFYTVFVNLILNFIPATIYIVYGLWLRKHGVSGKLPAFLKFYEKRMQTAKTRDRATSAMMTRIAATFGFIMHVFATLSPFIWSSAERERLDLQRFVSTGVSIIYSLAMMGLLFILANVIYPLRGKKEAE